MEKKGHILGIKGIYLFLLSLAFLVFNQAYAIDSDDPFPGTLPPQPDYSIIINSGCVDNEINPPNNPAPTTGDGLCNIWETQSGLRISYQGKTYKFLCVGYGGTEPVCPSTVKKDIYIEYDWFAGHEPNAQAITNVIQAFNTKNINLHVQQGGDTTFHKNLVEVMPIVGSQNYPPATEFNDIKKYFFGTPADRAYASYLTAKRQAFHYSLFGHLMEFPYTDFSGMAEMPGNDMFIALYSFGSSPTIDQTAGTFMHELGHNLGLDHGGSQTLPNSGIDCKPNYLSVMSSSRMTPDLIGSSGWELSYSSIGNQLVEGSLSESVLLDLAVGKTIVHGNDDGITMVTQVTSQGINWDNDIIFPASSSYPMDANNIQAIECNVGTPLETYNSYDDWNNLNFKFKVGSGPTASWGDGVAVGKFKDIFQKNQVKSKEAELTVPEKFNIFRDKEFKGINGTISITKSPKAQLDADIPPGQVICEQSHEFIYINRTKDSIGTPLCIKTIHFGKFLELFKEFIFFDQYICDINFSIGEHSVDASTIDSYINSKTGQPLSCSEYVKQYQ